MCCFGQGQMFRGRPYKCLASPVDMDAASDCLSTSTRPKQLQRPPDSSRSSFNDVALRDWHNCCISTPCRDAHNLVEMLTTACSGETRLALHVCSSSRAGNIHTIIDILLATELVCQMLSICMVVYRRTCTRQPISVSSQPWRG